MFTSDPSEERVGVRRAWATKFGARLWFTRAVLAVLAYVALTTSCTGSNHYGMSTRSVVISGQVLTAVCPEVPPPPPTTCTLAPTAGAAVMLIGTDGATVTSAVSGDDGSFLLTGSLAPDSYIVRATAPQLGAAEPATAAVKIEVFAGAGEQQVNKLEVRLDTGVR